MRGPHGKTTMKNADIVKVSAYWKSGADLSMPIFIRRLITVGRKDAHQIPMTALPMFGFMFLSSGEVLLDIGGVPLLLGRGQMLLIPPQTPFAVKYYLDSVGFTGGFRESFLKDPSHPVLREPSFSVNSFDEGTMSLLSEVFSRILGAYPDDTSYMRSAVDFIMAHLRPDDSLHGNSIATLFIDRVFDRTRTLGDVSGYAREMGISPDILNKIVHKYSTHSCMEWIEIARMAMSRQLLSETHLSVAQVSYAVGIEDPSYFSRFFRKREGLSPTQFRRMQSKKS